METPKFCKDCKWCKNNLFWRIISFGLVEPYYFAKCERPNGNFTNHEYLVAGFKGYYKYCSTERKNDCGPEAKFWEPK
jgi:hypothetical protein